ncbi:MAG TPA: hypothetical protein DEV85_00315 [Vibrio sp.]|nr:hypothetical protein [Vibrio sp.]
MPFVLDAAALLPALIHPNRIGKLCSWGFTHLAPHCNSNYFGYNSIRSHYKMLFSVCTTAHLVR